MIPLDDIWHYVWAARHAADMTQVEFGEALGVTSTHVSHLENGKSDPSIQLLRRMECLSGLPLFLEWKDPE